MKYNAIVEAITKLLTEHLSKDFKYHSPAHTANVISSVGLIAKGENVTTEEFALLQTAALFHDAGFLDGSKDHEERSCEIAQSYLPDYDYTQPQINIIKGMIMATKMPQNPRTNLEKILADADLDYLGRHDFFEIGNQLYDELFLFGLIKSEYEWNLLQKKFLEEHQYFTDTAKKIRNEQKKLNLESIKAKLVQV